MPFREPPDLDRVDTSFVSRAGTPASEQIRESGRSGPSEKPGAPEKKAPGEPAAAPPRRPRTARARAAESSVPPASEKGRAPAEGETSAEKKPARAARSRRRQATGTATSPPDEASQFVEPDARMLVNVRMPVALHERLKAASEHTSLTITDIVIRGTEAELRAMGYPVRRSGFSYAFAGVHAARRTASGWDGGADPGRDGMALSV